jgi:hypothetical protein
MHCPKAHPERWVSIMSHTKQRHQPRQQTTLLDEYKMTSHIIHPTSPGGKNTGTIPHLYINPNWATTGYRPHLRNKTTDQNKTTGHVAGTVPHPGFLLHHLLHLRVGAESRLHIARLGQHRGNKVLHRRGLHQLQGAEHKHFSGQQHQQKLGFCIAGACISCDWPGHRHVSGQATAATIRLWQGMPLISPHLRLKTAGRTRMQLSMNPGDLDRQGQLCCLRLI